MDQGLLEMTRSDMAFMIVLLVIALIAVATSKNKDKD